MTKETEGCCVTGVTRTDQATRGGTYLDPLLPQKESEAGRCGERALVNSLFATTSTWRLLGRSCRMTAGGKSEGATILRVFSDASLRSFSRAG